MLKLFTDSNRMKINEEKTHIMCFNFRTSLQFPPIFNIGDCSQLEVVKHTKLLGIIVSDDLRWSHHVEFMCQKAYKKVWLLRRMKILQLDQDIMLDFYCKEVRSILEFGVPCWNSGLKVKHSEQIERVQKICINIILCDDDWNIPYHVGCTLLGIEPLDFRRSDLCIRFAQKAASDPRHSDFNTLNNCSTATRQEKPIYREYSCTNDRFFNSPLCYLTRLLNQNPVKGCSKKG